MAQCSYKTKIPKQIKLKMIKSVDYMYITLRGEIPQIIKQSAKENVVIKKSVNHFKMSMYHRVLKLHLNGLLYSYIITNETGLLYIVHLLQIFHRKKRDMLKIFYQGNLTCLRSVILCCEYVRMSL